MRRIGMFLAAGLMAAAFALPAQASFHTAAARTQVLAEVSAITEQAVQTGKLTMAQAKEIRDEVTALGQKNDGLTLDDLKRVGHIRAVFAAAQIESITLGKAEVYVARIMGDLGHLYAHVVSDHGGKFE